MTTMDIITLSEPEQNAVTALCILAAFADGTQSETEREEVKRIADKFSSAERNLSTMYQDVLSGRLNCRTASAQLQSANAKALAYEMAVCICAADGEEKPSEKQFLKTLRDVCGLDAATAAGFDRNAQSVKQNIMPEPPVIAEFARKNPELDQMILNRSILAGALELMPHSLATMAILPVQIQTVYAVGKKYGYDLDWSHAKEFLATVGVGIASQMVEGYLTRIVSGLTNRFAGKWTTALLTQATQSALAFATTYALGQAARSYYSGGRTLSNEQVRNVFSSMFSKGQALKSQYADQIINRSQSLNVADLANLARV